MIEESVFECCEIDEEEDYHKEFNEIIKKIIKYFEAELGVNFTEEEYYLQAIDVYDCNYIKYVADINNSDNKMIISVPIDQFIISIEDANKNTIINSYCYIELPQYEQENLNRIKDVLLDFENKFKP